MRYILILQKNIINLSLSIASLLKIIILSRPTKVSNINIDSEDFVILGNGPSFTSMYQSHKEFLKGKDLICVNHFPSTDLYEELQPKYYITLAPDLFDETVDKEFRERGEALFKTIAKKTCWELEFIMPFYAKKFSKWREVISENKHIKITYINSTPVEGVKSINYWFFRQNMGMPRAHNVMIPSVFIGINLKYKNIYLWGADHSWLPQISVDDNNVALINQKHFYDPENSKPSPFDKNGVGVRRLHEILRKFMLAFEGYFVLKEYADKNNVKILNCTPNSYIDAFDRLKI